MKNKPIRHKESNTFKFQPFAERIKNIDVDIFHRVGHKFEEDADDTDTYFYRSLQKWNVMNLSESYETFRKELPCIQTLPLLLNQKKEVVSILLKHLEFKNLLSLQALLELVVALTRDLRHEIYPFYPDILQHLIALLATKDADQLEWVFTCLAYMFKFLWKYLIKDLNTVFDSLLPLLTDNRPEYINNFAAESFAFVARKAKNKKDFLTIILHTLQNRPDSIVGCGRLMFEVIRGIAGRFHSCAETMLPLYLTSLADHSLPQRLLFEVLIHTVAAMCVGIQAKHTNLFWTVAFDTVNLFLPACNEDAESLCLVLKLVQQAVCFQDAVLLAHPIPVVKQLMDLLEQSTLPEAILKVASDIGASMLLSRCMLLPQEYASRMTLKILAVPYPGILLSFVRKVLSYSGFEVLILPRLMGYCHTSLMASNDVDKDVLHILTRLILHKAPPCDSGIDLEAWKQYPLEFPSSTSKDDSELSKKNTCLQPLLNFLSFTSLDVILDNMEDILCVMFCLPHFKYLEKDPVVKSLSRMIAVFCSALNKEWTNGTMGSQSSSNESEMNGDVEVMCPKEDEKTQNMIFLMSVVLETQIHLTDSRTLRDVCEFDLVMRTLLLYVTNPKYLSALRALDLYLTAYKACDESKEFTCELLDKLYSELGCNFSSPFHKVRLLTTHIFSLFEESLELPSMESNEPTSVFSHCLAAESVAPTINDYRNKLQYLQKLSYEAAQIGLSKYSKYNKVPLQYLLGVLFINFRLLWEPTIKLILSHARGLPLTEFWEIFLKHLILAAKQGKEGGYSLPSLSGMTCEFLQEVHNEVHRMNDKPDYINYRILLWKALAEFPDVCEVKNRDVTPLFLSFINEEYFKSSDEVANTWNIKQTNRSSQEMEVDEPEEEDEVKTINTALAKTPPPSTRNTSMKATSKTLLAHLGVFAKLRTPKALYREPELNKLYHELLTHKNPDVQKLALDCIMTYKHKFLLPYKDHLYGLLSDKTFKTEITTFRIDKESTIILEEHRADLVPVILRVVYSKMLTKTGARTSGKSCVYLRRSLVLRFLAGCHQEEMMLFLEMAFRNYAKFNRDDPLTMVREVMNSVNLEAMIPPKRLQSSMNLLGVIMDKFGSLMGQQVLPYLLHVLLGVGATVTGALLHKDTIYPGYLSILRSLRTACLDTAARFFYHFNNFLWTTADIDAIFEVFVWPILEKLPVEGVHSPTALLKLFVAWSQHSRYFVLLAKCADNDLTPLPYIMKLLVGEKTHPSVTNVIMEMVERLLTRQDYRFEPEDEEEHQEPGPDLVVSSVLSVDPAIIRKVSAKVSEELNYGSILLLEHIPAILERLKRKLASSRGRGLGQRDLVVLARISELVSDSAMSEVLLELLLPMLRKKASAAEHTVMHLVTTLANLIENIPDPEKYLRYLAPLFGEVSTTAPRKLLCDVLVKIAERSSGDRKDALSACVQLVGEINAWDARWVEQPDYNRRLDGFKHVHKMLEANQIELELGVIIIHNCFYLLGSEKDMSLRDSAGFCLRKLTPALCLKYCNSAKDREFLVNDTLLHLVRVGIRSKNDTIQREAISLLGEMARECADVHPVLRDLAGLTNKTDPEVDFFENLLHLQTHRKSRALLKFCDVTKNVVKAPNPRTLTQFIFPLASSFLCSEKYASKNSIVDAAINTVGMVCRLLPWHQYETILRFYLNKLRHLVDYQKQLVRIVVAILDAFHFDLSRAQEVAAVSSVVAGKSQPNTIEKTDEEMKMTTIDSKIEKEKSLDKDVDNEEQNSEDHLEENVDDNLDDILDTVPTELTIDTDEKVTLEPAASRQTTLPHSTANRVIHTIVTGLLPQLHHTIAQRTQADTLHKVNRKQAGPDQDEEDILRVPIALAVVKLLQRLPSYMLKQHLPGIFMKLCTFLKSRLDSVRRITRETLQKVMISLGASYLDLLLSEMIALLTRGFHVHVLIYTIHSVLVSLKEHLKTGDLDGCLPKILGVCKMDLFGAVSEEKDVSKITSKLFEARSTKSYDTLLIVAQHITERCFTDLILPFKEVLGSTTSFTPVHRASECLRHIVIGLADNTFVTVESLLIFLYGIVSERIPELLLKDKKEGLTTEQREQEARKRPDTFLIPKAPRSRSGAITVTPRTSARTNAHILVESGFRLYAALLKREKLRSPDLKPYLDPLVPLLSDSLNAQHIKVSVIALQCLTWVLKMDLPSLKECIERMTASVFKLLHKHAITGMTKGTNCDLTSGAFKVVTVLIRDIQYHTIKTEQLNTLLTYIEMDTHQHSSRQTAAFTLLKAILSRKLVTPELSSLMEGIAKLSVLSITPHVRVQARQVVHQFLMDYPLGGKLEYYVSFYISQLNYELKPGRESALEMVFTMISTFPLGVLVKHTGLMFLTLGAQLVNDDDPDCRKMVAHCIKTMLSRLETFNRNELFSIVTTWFKDEKVAHRRLAAQLCGIFALVEKEKFEHRLTLLLPVLLQQFNNGITEDNVPGRFVRLPRPEEEISTGKATDEQKERMRDHHLFQVLQLLLKVFEHCPAILKNSDWQNHVETIAENAEFLVAHPHEWVRLAAAQLLGHVFGSLDVEAVALAAVDEFDSSSSTNKTYLFVNTRRKLRSLVLDFCAQLQPVDVGQELVDQVIKNLVFLGKVLKALPEKDEEPNDKADDSEVKQQDHWSKLTFLWMIRRMRKVANTEIIHAPKSTIVRTAVFQWIGAMVMDLDRKALQPVLPHLLAPLVREMTSQDELLADLRRVAKDVGKIMKQKIGHEEYTQHTMKLETRLSVRRAGRKKERAQNAVREPMRAAKRKISKQLKKKDVKKKRVDRLKGRKFPKRKLERILEVDET